jgi:hypothetical protein
MKAITQSKLTKRLLLLFVLAGTFIYLRAPTQARAFPSCICQEVYGECVAHCDGNASCIATCETEYKECYAIYCE